MVEDENKISSRQKKIAAITILSASVAFVASVYLTAEDEEEHIFSGATDKRELHKIWIEYNRANHPDKCSLEGEKLEEHMREYHDTKQLYEDLTERL